MQASSILPGGTNRLLSREIFGNVSHFSQVVFYILAYTAMAFFCWGVCRRLRLWKLGKNSRGPGQQGGEHGWVRGARRAWGNILLQRRMIGRPLASRAHRLLFVGLSVLFIGTLLIAVEHVLEDLLGRAPDNPVFHKGLYYAIYEFTLDAFGIVMLLGCLLFLARRWRGNSSIAQTPLDWLVLLGLLAIGLSGYFVEGLRIIHSQTPLPGISFVGYVVARGLEAGGVQQESAGQWHVLLWWGHALLALGLIGAFPYTRLLHSVAGARNLLNHRPALGSMRLVEMEEVEETGLVGAGSIEDFTRVQLRSLDACVSCGRCEDACPAFEANKPLSPRDLVQDLRSQLDLVGPGLLGRPNEGQPAREPSPVLPGDAIGAETLWSCTTCSACADLCPLGISPVGFITDMRRYLVAEGQLRGSPMTSLQKTQRSGNPWGLPKEDRFAWADGLEVPTVEDNPHFDILYWVGCAAAYDRRIQRVARSMVQLLRAAGVNFAVLGRQERCTGETARRMGDEFLFQELAGQNVQTLGKHGVRRIVAHCPHCVNSFLHDYPQMGGQYEVLHHSQLLAELLEQGRLKSAQATLPGLSRPPISSAQKPLGSTNQQASRNSNGTGKRPADKKSAAPMTYHDPCYLARVNGLSEAPRAVLAGGNLQEAPDCLIEAPRNRRQTSCCGAGGGRMWFDDSPSQRIGTGRMEELQATGAKTVAVSCPFCLVMITDGMAAMESEIEVRDIAEVLAAELELDPNGT